MSRKLVLNQMNLFLIQTNGLSQIGRRFSANVTNIANKTQITSGYSRGQTIRYPISSKNIILRHCPPIPSVTLSDGVIQSVPLTTTRRPLTLIFSWMLAKDKHLEKYRQMWFRKGFDVLTVKTSPLDLLIPPIGGRILAKNLVNYLSEINSLYNEIVVHAFSVGGYQFGETLSQLRELEDQTVLNSIKGVVFDSCVFTEDCAPGLSRAITLNPIVQPMIESSIAVFLKLFYNISVKNYERASEAIFNPVVPYKGLALYSTDDIVSNYKTNERLVKNWIKRGNEMRGKCWTNSTHVLHYRDHESDYEQEVNAFIKSLKLRNDY